MGPEAWIPIACGVAGGLFTAYRFYVERTDKRSETGLSLLVAKTQAETSQSDVLMKGQQAFADEVIRDAARLRDAVKTLELDKLTDLQLIARLSNEKLDLELEVKRQKQKVIEEQQEKDDLNDIIKILETRCSTLEVDIITLKATVEQRDVEIRRLNKVLKEIGHGNSG
jgi:hypothetical protein